MARLGAGGMGEVWLAQGPTGQVVVKTMLPELADDARFTMMFLREARIAAQVESARVVAVKEVGAERGAPFLVLEYVRGVSLQRLLSKQGKLEPALAAAVAIEVARALQDVHDAVDTQGARLGVVHRDVSPSNVLLSCAGEVKLSDFGIAKLRDTTDHSATTQGAIRGKIAYLSPEQARGDALDHRTDFFALGVMLHRMLTGELPYSTRTDFALIQEIAAGQRRALRDVLPGLPEPVYAAVAAMLSQEPSGRPSSGERVAMQLEEAFSPEALAAARADLARRVSALFEAEPRPAAPTTTAEVAPPPPAKGAPKRALALGAGVLAAVALAAGGLALTREESPAPPPEVPTNRPEPVPSTPPPPAAATAPVEPAVADPSPPAPSPPVEPEAPAARRIRLEVEPPCTVFIGNRELGKSPLSVPVTSGEVRLTVRSAERGIDYSETLKVGPQQKSLKLTVPKGTLQLRIAPYSEVTLDGRALGEGPYPVLDVYAGRHQVVVVNRELNVRRKEVVPVAAREQHVFRLKLQ
ncbi:MAG: serine/threonine protein kinase [Myxococcaceae bacterium]|nr:serine/threonine protein kinase [Myxococcaceae bacterium]